MSKDLDDKFLPPATGYIQVNKPVLFRNEKTNKIDIKIKADDIEIDLALAKELFVKIRNDKQKTFLITYSRKGSKKWACALAGVNPSLISVWKSRDPDFKAAFDLAKAFAVDNLEDEAWARAVDGEIRKKFTSKGDPIIDPDTNKQYCESVKSDVLLQFLLKSLRPEVYDRKAEIVINSTHGTDSMIDLKKLTNTELEVWLALNEKITVIPPTATKLVDSDVLDSEDSVEPMDDPEDVTLASEAKAEVLSD